MLVKWKVDVNHTLMGLLFQLVVTTCLLWLDSVKSHIQHLQFKKNHCQFSKPIINIQIPCVYLI
jgi:hypothetical protein